MRSAGGDVGPAGNKKLRDIKAAAGKAFRHGLIINRIFFCEGASVPELRRYLSGGCDAQQKTATARSKLMTFNPIIPSLDSGVPKGGHGWVLDARRSIGSNTERSAVSANRRFATTSASRAQN